MSQNITDTLKEALYTIKVLKQEREGQPAADFIPMAIIGISCRFPGANGKHEFWQLLKDKKNVISAIPDTRWQLLRGTEEEAIKSAAQHCKGSFLAKISAFDPYFFSISPREAIHIDPQHRLLLEVTYEACEDAGVSVENLSGSNTGVFTSLYASQFGYLQKDDPEFDALIDALHIASGNAVSMAANRISYTLDLHGPSVVYDTACSSSLVALHSACKNLQDKTCDLAIVGGVNINLLPSINLLLSRAKMLSPDGQCKTFDAQANGYVPGEGVGVVIIKRLDDAIKNKDRIYSVILGSAVNQDGKTNGLTAPNGLQQEALIKSACKIANINADEISYVECHGTGTLLGDPIEVQALGDVLSQNRSQKNPCWIGSVKTNMGHLEPAAGVASIIKVSLALQHEQIPAHLNFHTPNPFIAFDKYHFQIPEDMQAWPKYGEHRLAGVSGFGFGGTNAHIIMREFDEIYEDVSESNIQQLFTVSAKDSLALKLLIDSWVEFLENNKNISYAQICYNVHLRRSHYVDRLGVIASSTEELLSLLKKIQHTSFENANNGNTIFVNINKTKTPSENSGSDLQKLAIKYMKGESIDWAAQHSQIYPHTDMPLYPWQHQDYWPQLKKQVASTQITYPFSKEKVNSPLMQYLFQVDSNILPELADTYYFLHAGYYIEMLSYAIQQQFQQNNFSINDFNFKMPIAVSQDKPATIQLIMQKQNNQFEFNFYSLSGTNQWLSHASGLVNLAKANVINIDIDAVKSRCKNSGSSEDFQNKLHKMNVPTGGSIHWINQYWLNANEVLCKLTSPVDNAKHDKFDLNIHPGVIDAAIQSLFILLPAYCLKPYIATTIGRLIVENIANKNSLYLYAKLTSLETNGKHYTGNIYLLNIQGEIIFTFENITMTQLSENIHLDKISRDETAKADLQSIPLDERKKVIEDFLIDKVASIFSIPKAKINIDRSLKDAGMDSLMAVVIVQAIEAKFHLAFTIQQLLANMSIADISNEIIEMTLQTSTEISNPWIAYRQPKAKSKVKLFCFPYGGAGASVFNDWPRLLPEFVDVCPIQYPGREERINEKAFTDIHALVDALCVNLKNELQTPFVFFGHSMGALIAFEVTRALRERNLPMPQHLIISAFPDPRMPAKRFDKFLKELNSINTDFAHLPKNTYTTAEAGLSLASKANQLEDETIKKIFFILKKNGLIEYDTKHADNTDIIKILLPIFLSDINIIKNYKYMDKPPLNIPFTIFTGKKDDWLQHEDHLGWCDQTLQKCDVVEFDSEHLFIKDKKVHREVLNKIASILLPLCNTPSRYAF